MLFMRTILSLSLATFALAIPVAQPQAVGDLGGIGPSLIGRDDAVIFEVFDGIESIVNGALGGAVTSGLLSLNIDKFLIGELDGMIVILAEAVPLDTGAINNLILSIESVIGRDLGDAVKTGNLTQDVVDHLTIDLVNLVSGALGGGSDSA